MPGKRITRRRYPCYLEQNLHRGRGLGARVYSLIEDFDGELLYYPEIVPVTIDFRRAMIETASDPKRLFEFSPRQFEELVADIWRRFGYCVELTSHTTDGGRDIIAIKQAEVNLRVLIECKRYSMANKVGVQVVRSLFGVKTDEKATKAILATTSRFTSGAKDFFGRHIWELEPRDFDGVVDWVKLAVSSGSL
jgi:hypothetical protein